MKCYIYKIINKVTNEKYVGQTTNFSRRINDHFYLLRKGTHKNYKLQAAFNQYGEQAFEVQKWQYDLSQDELDKLEIQEILLEDSFNNGYNLTRGGGGWGFGGREKLNFDQFCFAYFGNKKYDGMTNRTGESLNVDSACIAAIRRDESYTYYRNWALELPDEIKQYYLEQFEKILQVKEKPPITQRKKLTQDELNIFLSVVSVYGRGAEAAISKHFNISKGLKYHIAKGEYAKEYQIFKSLPEETIIKIADSAVSNYNLQQYVKVILRKNKKLIYPS